MAGVPPASCSDLQPTRLPLQTSVSEANPSHYFLLVQTGWRGYFRSVTKFDLRREDCITGMSRLAEESVDLVVTSPPYNLGISYGKYSDRQDRVSYLAWCGEWAGQVRRVLRPDGSFFLNIGAAPSNPMLPYEIVITLRELFVLQNTIHWIKSIAIEDRCKPSPCGRRKAQRSIRCKKGFPQGSGYSHSLVWPFQTDQFLAISQRLPRIRFSFHEVRSRRTESARAWRAVSG